MINKMIFLILLGISTIANSATAIFAGGCFWCSQVDLSKIKGVKTTIVGYDGGKLAKPTYALVSSGRTRYIESVKVEFDPSVISYQDLVKSFLRTVDISQANGQFCDIGYQYSSAIFYLNNKQKILAQQELKALTKNFKKVETLLLASTHFYPAETYHQHYAKKNPIRYKYYRWRCGRDKKLKKLWGFK